MSALGRALDRCCTHWALGLIALYRYTAPLRPRLCRFHPTCSAYAAQAIARFGVVRGIALAAGRLLRCHPWHPGGIDSPPPPSARVRMP